MGDVLYYVNVSSLMKYHQKVLAVYSFLVLNTAHSSSDLQYSSSWLLAEEGQG